MNGYLLTILCAAGVYALLWSCFYLKRRRAGDSAVTALAYVALVLWAAIVLLPCIWMTFMSFKESREIFTDPYGLPRAFTGAEDAPSATANFRAAWTDSHFARYFLNSVKVVAIATVLQLLIGSLAAYALTRFPFRINKALLFFFIAGMMVPGQIALFPLFFQYGQISACLTDTLGPVLQLLGYDNPVVSLMDSHTGLILIYVAGGMPFTILVLSGFFKSLPTELYEAARIDGCTEFQAFWKVMLPLAKPGLITVSIFTIIGLYNEYFGALVFITSDELKTIPLGLAHVSIQAQFRGLYGMYFAALVIASIPTLVVFFCLQRHITRGITAGAVKG